MVNSGVPTILQPDIPAGDDWLDPADVAKLTPEIIRQRMVDIQPLIGAHAREAEERRRLAPEVIAAIRSSGYFYLMVPRAYGGMGATPLDLLDASIPIGEKCMSTAWVSSFVVNHNWLASHLPDEAHRETWGSASPYLFAPAVTNPPATGRRVNGGYRLNGRWKWGTGVMNADWIIGFALLETDDQPAFAITLFPASDARILDTWRVDGLSGTGSHDILVEDLFVPAYRTAFVAPILDGTSNARSRFGGDPLYGMPMIPFLTFAGSVPIVGAARAAIAAVADRLTVHKRVGDTVTQVEKPLSQARLARADLLVRTGETIIRKVGRELIGYQDLSQDERLSARLRWRAQVAEGVHLCRAGAEAASASAGSSLHFLDNPLQRILRDVSVGSTHYAFDLDAAHEQYGRRLVGLAPTSTLF